MAAGRKTGANVDAVVAVWGRGGILILSRPRANAKVQRLRNVSGDYIQLQLEGAYRAASMKLVIIDSGECKLLSGLTQNERLEGSGRYGRRVGGRAGKETASVWATRRIIELKGEK
jgi:hypothetical protein